MLKFSMFKLLLRASKSAIPLTRCLLATRFYVQLPQLSPYDINLILRENEYCYSFQDEGSALHSYESNQLASNNPCEDTRTEGSFIHQSGFICGIFDGHAGAACSQVVSKRLLRYIAAALVDDKVLTEQIAANCNSQSFLRCHNDKADFVKDIKEIYEDSFKHYIGTISSRNKTARDNGLVFDRAARLENAFLHLDEDISKEALEKTNIRTMSVAMSGAVAIVVHVADLDLNVASTGDCAAVLGSLCPESGKWQATQLNIEHNTDNRSEVERILQQHPREERETAIRNDRLLGQLAPLRALGDFRYKWSNEIMEKYVIPAFGEHVMPPNYYTPPYLTAKPDVQHHKLRPEDKFLIIASDGLWDFLSAAQAVNLVGDHLNSKGILEPVKTSAGVSLDEISNALAKRKAGQARKPLDQNSATHLIRNSLGGTDYGIEHSRLSYYLTLPQDMVRLYRDDITITVIYFNSDYIKNKTIMNESSATKK